MDRRKMIKMATGAALVGSAGVLTLTTAFSPDKPKLPSPKKIDHKEENNACPYSPLDPTKTSHEAYKHYSNGSCMYGVFVGIISQLAEKIGEPYRSFPIHMMKYGHGGIGGTGTICGSLNGASAIFGLLITDKKVRDALTADLFHWYKNTAFPSFKPKEAVYDYTPPTAVSKSVLCHASGTTWSKKNGFDITSNERKERCRRLTADVAAQTVTILNAYFDNTFITSPNPDHSSNDCMACHGPKGKVKNVSTQMNCSSCHEESVGHQLFSDVHYKMIKD